jgi:hypothetical protein
VGYVYLRSNKFPRRRAKVVDTLWDRKVNTNINQKTRQAFAVGVQTFVESGDNNPRPCDVGAVGNRIALRKNCDYFA